MKMKVSTLSMIRITSFIIGSIPGSAPGGRGTRNMAARANALGAELSIEPAEPGRRIRLSIPIVQKSADDANGPE